jgi:hypothetical protein
MGRKGRGKMNRRLPWTPQEEEILIAMVKGERTAEEIGKILKSRSIDAIRNKVYGKGLEFIGQSPEIDMEAFKKIMKGGK